MSNAPTTVLWQGQRVYASQVPALEAERLARKAERPCACRLCRFLPQSLGLGVCIEDSLNIDGLPAVNLSNNLDVYATLGTTEGHKHCTWEVLAEACRAGGTVPADQTWQYG